MRSCEEIAEPLGLDPGSVMEHWARIIAEWPESDYLDMNKVIPELQAKCEKAR
jgi:hypothetical protein